MRSNVDLLIERTQLEADEELGDRALPTPAGRFA
jgi:hypothetical protein